MSLSAHRRFPLGSEDESIRNQGLDILEKAIDYSVDLGIRYILIAGSDVYYQERNEKTLEYYLRSLEKGVAWAAKAGVNAGVGKLGYSSEFSFRCDVLCQLFQFSLVSGLY